MNQHQLQGKTKSVLGTFSSNQEDITGGAGYTEHVSKTNVKNSPNPTMMVASTEMKNHHKQSTSVGAG
jgi:hypothetical protein